MPQTCTICRHADRQEIDEALLDGRPLRNIAEIFSGIGTSALHRHKQAGHLAEVLVKAKEVEVELMAEPLADRLRSINAETKRILQEAKDSNSPTLQLTAISRIERQIELEAKILVRLDETLKITAGFTPPEPERDIAEELKYLSDDDLRELIRLKRKMQGLDV